MKAFRGKLVAYTSGAIAVMVLIAASVKVGDQVYEDWLISKLTRGEEAARKEAANNLSQRGSPRAVKALLNATATVISDESHPGFNLTFDANHYYLVEAIAASGKAAIPILLDYDTDGDKAHVFAARLTLLQFGFDHGLRNLEAVFEALKSDMTYSPKVREAASAELKKYAVPSVQQ